MPVGGAYEADDSRSLGDAAYAGLGIGVRPAGECAKVERFSAASLENNVAEPDENGRRLVSSGRPAPGLEVLVVGEPSAVQMLIDWLWSGPPAARVSHVEVEPVELAEEPTEFTTR